VVLPPAPTIEITFSIYFHTFPQTIKPPVYLMHRTASKS
jgi:hypothetical protein